MNRPISSSQSGATLIEVLITMLVVAVGLLGAAGIQLASTRFQQTSVMRSEAFHQASFIIEKIRANNATMTLANAAAAAATPAAAYIAEEDYASAVLPAVPPAPPACGLGGQAPCTAAQAAQRDLLEWRLSIQQALPGGRGAIFPVVGPAGAAEPNARRVVVMWREKLDQANTNTAGLDADENLDLECPALRVPGIRCLNVWITP
jgi:type IV pilus assembly protein PilV